VIVDVVALLQVVLLGAETVGAAIEVIDAINDALTLLTIVDEPAYDDLTLEQKTDVLKRCTKIVVNLNLNLSCFPLGYTTTLLFDLDGNPIP